MAKYLPKNLNLGDQNDIKKISIEKKSSTWETKLGGSLAVALVRIGAALDLLANRLLVSHHLGLVVVN